MNGTLRYIISLLMLAVFSASNAQDKLERQVFVRVGLDLSRFAMPLINDNGQTGLELSMDTELAYRYFPTIEAGYSQIKDYTDLHHYDSYGNYFRVGFNYCMSKYKHRLDRNLFFIGARYGYTGYTHKADLINITNQWGTLETSFAETQLNAHWFEGVIGLRGEIVKNFYMGYTIRVKQMLSHSEYGNYTPYWIPGFGKATKSITIGISYSIFYAIPIKNPKPIGGTK